MPSPSRLVAVIEDEQSSADALSLILRDWGADVAIGDSAQSVAATLGPRIADVGWIITDFHLGPGPDGITLVRDIAAAAPRARILVLSGSFHGRATAAAAKAGFEIMQKPARADKIIAWLNRN